MWDVWYMVKDAPWWVWMIAVGFLLFMWMLTRRF
jgi:hypothetical protein